MNLFEKLLAILATQIETAPKSYGILHFIMVALVIGCCIFLCYKFSDCTDRVYRKILLIIWIILLIGESYHQICFSFSVQGDSLVWDYPWYKFPFQFCSSPLYILPFVIFLREGKLRDGFIAFLISFSTFAGIAVMVYPNDVFTTIIGVSIQTMIHHGLQVVIGVFTVAVFRKRLCAKFFALAIPIFASLLAIAFIMNIVGFNLLRANGMDDTFNMFFISPYFNCTLPVLSDIYLAVPYPVFIAIYTFGFTGVAALIFYIQRLIAQATVKIKNDDKNSVLILS